VRDDVEHSQLLYTGCKSAGFDAWHISRLGLDVATVVVLRMKHANIPIITNFKGS
jgi:hypothetical protein